MNRRAPSLDAKALAQSVDAHDEAVGRECGLWMGAEPTFTDRLSEAPEWLNEALGDDKRERARRLIRLLVARQPGALLLRPVGRQYAGEPKPRWSYGVYAARDGATLWSGPEDRLLDAAAEHASGDGLNDFAEAVVQALRAEGWFASPVSPGPADKSGKHLAIVCNAEGHRVASDAEQDERLARPSIHQAAPATAGVVDTLAQDGLLLVLLHGGVVDGEHNRFWVELPGFTCVRHLKIFVAALARAAASCGVESLGLRGFPPPVDESVAWTTLTPDPAVLEVNQAPEPSARKFLDASRTLFELASEVGLSPYRLQYNGTLSDSGGGGQLTFGGSAPDKSPFFTHPQLLPRLIRYVIRHPSLSYWFATQYIGGSSQSPRPDEGVRESFLELEVALEQLGRMRHPSPEMLWSSLRHFMVDASGNPHRSELNIEKLHNPYLLGRGCLGLVELRALCMAESVNISVARALLFRAIVCMLRRQDVVPELCDWRDELHDRFALPWFLRADLREVFRDLATAELGIGEHLETLLLARHGGVLGNTSFAGYQLTIEQALEFWPLLGDVASQEGGSSRLVDASTSRYEIRLSTSAPEIAPSVEVRVNGYRVPLQTEITPDGVNQLLGLRFRSFKPSTGLHPAMPAEGTIVLELLQESETALRVTLHPWRPDGAAYDGLPKDLDDARARRAERVVVQELARSELTLTREPPAAATTAYCLDLRRLPDA